MGWTFHFLAFYRIVFSATIASVQFCGTERHVDRADLSVGNESLSAHNLDVKQRVPAGHRGRAPGVAVGAKRPVAGRVVRPWLSVVFLPASYRTRISGKFPPQIRFS